MMKKQTSQSLRISRVGSLVTLVLGVALMIYMITVEDEPGALPLFLIITGTAWFLFNRFQINKKARPKNHDH